MQKSRSIFVGGTAKQVLPTESNPGVAEQLFRNLVNSGFVLTNNPNSYFFLSINHDRKAYSRFIKSGGSAKNAILIRREPQAVHPIQYRRSVEVKYGLVLSPGATSGIQKRKVPINTPYAISGNPNSLSFSDLSIKEVLSMPGFQNLFTYNDWQKRRFFLSLIASNKVSPSKHENYSLRRRIVGSYGKRIEVFGQYWGASLASKIALRLRVAVYSLKSGYVPHLKSIYGDLFHNYRHVNELIDDKSLILRDSCFSLVIENDSTCLTEKLFDAFFSGSIPIYFGPELSQYGIPQSLFFNLNQNFEINLQEIQELKDFEIQARLSAIIAFISTENFFEKWSDEQVFASIAEEIRNYISANSNLK